MKLNDNHPLLWVIALPVIIALCIRLTAELLAPVWPYLLVALIAFGLIRAHLWWRGRL